MVDLFALSLPLPFYLTLLLTHVYVQLVGEQRESVTLLPGVTGAVAVHRVIQDSRRESGVSAASGTHPIF